MLGLLITFHSVWTLIANNRNLSQKSLVWTSLLIVAVSGIVLFSGTSINLTNNNNQAQAQEQQQQVGRTKINKLWETPDDLKNPESVAYAPKQNVLFVSNIDGKPDEKDQKGFISKVSPSNGSIIELNWITGLNAPKGIAISNDNGKLYVSDITDLVEIDIASGKIIKRFNAPGSAFLNDVISDNQGNIYVSDTITNTIYKLDTNVKDNNTSSLQAWLQNPQLNGPNGLHVDNNKNRLIVASLGDFSKPGAGIEVVDLKNKTISSLGKEGTTSPFGGLDGIESDATETHYYVTDNPAGKVYTVNADGTGYGTLIDLHTQGTADLGFIQGQSTIIIPIMQDNKLVAYKLSE
ncbi:MAG: SMP-30/gluconolactonase/LRE family protein [Nitrososphaeraceae archaeon]